MIQETIKCIQDKVDLWINTIILSLQTPSRYWNNYSYTTLLITIGICVVITLFCGAASTYSQLLSTPPWISIIYLHIDKFYYCLIILLSKPLELLLHTYSKVFGILLYFIFNLLFKSSYQANISLGLVFTNPRYSLSSFSWLLFFVLCTHYLSYIAIHYWCDNIVSI